jgi:hypothetical protein
MIPGKARDLRALLTPAGRVTVDRLSQAVRLDKAIANAPANDIYEFFEDKYGLAIFVDEWAFRQAGKKGAGDVPCQLPAGMMTLAQWLEKVASQVGGVVVVGEETVLIVPHKKDAKPVGGQAPEKK